jgi:hypothetical protein
VSLKGVLRSAGGGRREMEAPARRYTYVVREEVDLYLLYNTPVARIRG